ncbi:MAG: exodeoxyribonuclease III [Planctomycetes bacterium]|nr:exodeoxyribonuclease III [Planctomycetota bacterium]
MRIATWNVNSVRARLPRLVPWLERQRPDVLCIQETKVRDEEFPAEPLEDQGYNLVCFGQKTYNGVAILARHRIEAVVRGFPDDGEDADRRLLGAIVGDVVFLNVYVPNGQEVGSAKYRYKLDWLARLRHFLDQSYDLGEKLVVLGDFNVTFDDRDVYDPEAWREQIHCSLAEREALRRLAEFGLHDALRELHPEAGIYTWWDHRGGAFPKDHGLRIDHLLMSPKARKACSAVFVDRDERKGKGASDHAPVVAELD